MGLVPLSSLIRDPLTPPAMQDPARRRPSVNQEVGSHQALNLPVL